MRQRIRRLLKHTGFDLWTLANKTGVNVTELEDYMMSSDQTLAHKDIVSLDKFLLNTGLCPMCGSAVTPYGGCEQCFSCGWAKCG